MELYNDAGFSALAEWEIGLTTEKKILDWLG